MNQSTDKLILNLTKDLKPVKPIKHPMFWVFSWLLFTAISCSALMSLTGGMRPGWFYQMTENFRFSMETFMSFLSVWSVGALCVYQSIPGFRKSNLFSFIALLPFAIYTGMLLFGLESPALEPSMIGKRNFCLYETMAFGAGSFVVLFIFIQKIFVPLKGSRVGFFAGLGAAGFPCAAMQVACMYDPHHNLMYHVAPAIFIACIGSVLGKKFLTF